MRRTFVKVGLAKDEDGKYAVYKSHKKAGWLIPELKEGDGRRCCFIARDEFGVLFCKIVTEVAMERADAEERLNELRSDRSVTYKLEGYQLVLADT